MIQMEVKMVETYLDINEKDFVQIFGTPIHPVFVGGHLVRSHVFMAHWSAEVNGEYWMIFDTLKRGSQESMTKVANNLNNDENMRATLQDPRFAVGPTFMYSDRDKGMKSVDDPQMGYTVYINRLPSFDPMNIERVQQLYL